MEIVTCFAALFFENCLLVVGNEGSSAELRRRQAFGKLETREARLNYEEDSLFGCWKRGRLGGTTKKTIFGLAGNEGGLVELRRRRSLGLLETREAGWNYEEDDLLACWKRGKLGGTTKKTIFWLVCCKRGKFCMS